jgi:AcrR family transcriptional regulator
MRRDFLPVTGSAREPGRRTCVSMARRAPPEVRSAVGTFHWHVLATNSRQGTIWPSDHHRASSLRIAAPRRAGRTDPTPHRRRGGRLLASRGWTGVSMRDVASEADVSVETIYAQIGTKAELLKTAMDWAIVGDAEPVPMADRPEFRRVGEGSWSERLTAAGALAAGVNAREARLNRALEHGALTDSVLDDMLRAGWRTRHQTVRAGLTALLQRRPTPREVDETYVVLGPQTYLSLVDEVGWTNEEYAAWVADALARLLHIDLSGQTEEGTT